MTKAQIPPTWRHLHAGEQVGTRLPAHRIDALFKTLEREGWRFDKEPSPRGYWIICRSRPANA